MSVDTALQTLINALRRHAHVMTLPDVPVEEGTAAFEEVRSAARGYSDAVFEASGWGSPFDADMYEDDEDDDDEEDDDGDDGEEKDSHAGG
jgi:hypothetical protein